MLRKFFLNLKYYRNDKNDHSLWVYLKRRFKIVNNEKLSERLKKLSVKFSVYVNLYLLIIKKKIHFGKRLPKFKHVIWFLLFMSNHLE